MSSPVLKSCIEDDTLDLVVDLVFTPSEDGFITVGVDRSLRIWLKRETGQYWPSVCHFLNSPCSVLCFSQVKHVLFVGQDSGDIEEFQVAQDFNQITLSRKYSAHQKQITGCEYSYETNIMVSCGKDKNITWHWTQNGERLGAFVASAPLTCLQYDFQSHYVFGGMTSNDIVVLKISKNNFQVVATLKGHTDALTCLCWDPLKQILYSGGNDCLINAWDIGGKKGTMIQLQGHSQKITSVDYSAKTSQLYSTSSDGTLIVWNMSVKRIESATWLDADHCMKCNQHFFWNLKQMWSSKSLGHRRHHCRKCGVAVCITCAPNTTILPKYGFECEVRVCNDCFKDLTHQDLIPTAQFHNLQQNILKARSDWSRGWLACSGTNRTIKLFDLQPLMKNPS